MKNSIPSRILSTTVEVGNRTPSRILEMIDHAVDGFPFDRYMQYPSEDGNSWKKYHLTRCGEHLNDEEFLFLYEEVHDSPFLMKARISTWDENHFGFKLASLSLFQCDSESLLSEFIERALCDLMGALEKENVRFVAARFHVNNLQAIHAAESVGYRYFENIVYPILSCESVGKLNIDGVRLMREDDLDDAMRIAGSEQYQEGHLYLDKKFDRDAVNSMYSKWVETAWKNDDLIVVIEDQSRIGGYFVLTENKKLSDALGFKYFGMRSLALDRKLRGHGLGARLFKGAVREMINMGAQYIESGYSIRNYLSAKLHENTGFHSNCGFVTLHKWL